MRIVQLIESLDLGGLERMAVDLALAQHAAGHQVFLYCLFGAGVLRAELDERGIPIVTFHKNRRSNASLVHAMFRQLRRDRADVINAHNPGVHHSAALAKFAARVPVLVNTRHSATTSTGAPYQERYFRLVAPLTDHVVFDCDFVRQQLKPRLRFPESKYSVILNGIRQDPFIARPACPGSAAGRIRFGTVGRLVPAKGHSVLIDAFSQVAARLPQAELAIFGYGPLEGEMKRQIDRLGMADRIRLAGRTDRPAEVFADLDIFVFSSVNEGLPLVIMEAMTAGLPIVSTRVGGVPEVAPPDVSARYCEPSDAGGLARAMIDLAATADLKRMGAESRRIALEKHGIARMSREYEGLYDRLLARRR